jgi:hypothetical protein
MAVIRYPQVLFVIIHGSTPGVGHDLGDSRLD